jgi:hypothetical protein
MSIGGPKAPVEPGMTLVGVLILEPAVLTVNCRLWTVNEPEVRK